jgi:hypothetical protein
MSTLADVNTSRESFVLRPKPDRRRQRRVPPQDIARLAYAIYQERGGGGGRDLDDWLQAERELRGASSPLGH